MERQADTMSLECEWINGKVRVTARLHGEPIFINTIDPASAWHRHRFAKALKDKLPEADVAAVDRELLRIADSKNGQAGRSEKPAGIDSQDAADTLLAQMPAEIRAEAETMLTDRLLIQRIVDDVAALDVAGEKLLTATIYLVGVSRLLERPLAAIVQGPSSSGKSYVIEKTAALFPPEALIRATQMTPQALFHMRPGTLAFKFIVAGERSRVEDDERAEATRALREMLSAGTLTKLMPVKVDGGIIETVQIHQDGPIAYVESTTLAKVFDEDANRCLMLNTDEGPEQSRRVIRQLAESYGRTGITPTDQIIHRHYALQRSLKRLPVVIPYAERLGEQISSERVEVRRGFPQLVSMIQAAALLHQKQREQDADGRLVATAEDYQLARHLLLKPMARLLGGDLSDPVRKFYDRLAKWVTTEFTSTEAKRRETSSKSSVYGWLGELHEAGLLDLIDAPRGRTPAVWRLSGKVPDETASVILPATEDIFPTATWKDGHKTQNIMAS